MSGERGVSRRFLVVVACFLGALLAPAVAKAAPTIVSLTFDDGTADQYAARTMLAQHSLHGTFYINSNNIGLSPSFLSWNQVADLAADGNEIAGHTLDHVDLTSVTSTEATRQVCNDRQALISHGFATTDFAYPYGASNASVESIVRRVRVLVCPEGVGSLQYRLDAPELQRCRSGAGAAAERLGDRYRWGAGDTTRSATSRAP